jgi:hypothetical protein
VKIGECNTKKSNLGRPDWTSRRNTWVRRVLPDLAGGIVSTDRISGEAQSNRLCRGAYGRAIDRILLIGGLTRRADCVLDFGVLTTALAFGEKLQLEAF